MKHKHIHESYQIYGNFQYYYEQNDLAVARFTHLVELMFEHSYIPGTDYKTLFMTEFRNIIDKVAGNYIRIWQDINDNKLEKWIERWVDKKTMPERDWYNKYYDKFYDQTYIPYMDNFASYLLGDPNTRKPDFWRCYLNTYLRENRYP